MHTVLDGIVSSPSHHNNTSNSNSSISVSPLTNTISINSTISSNTDSSSPTAAATASTSSTNGSGTTSKGFSSSIAAFRALLSYSDAPSTYKEESSSSGNLNSSNDSDRFNNNNFVDDSSSSIADNHNLSISDEILMMDTDDLEISGLPSTCTSLSLDSSSASNTSTSSLLLSTSNSRAMNQSSVLASISLCNNSNSSQQLSSIGNSDTIESTTTHHVMPYQLRRKSPGLRLKSPSISPDNPLHAKILTNNITLSPSTSSSRSILEAGCSGASLLLSESNNIVKIYPSSGTSGSSPSNSLSVEEVPQSSGSFSVCSPTLAGSGGMAINNPPNPPIPNTPSTPGPSQQMIPPAMLPINLNESPRSNTGTFNVTSSNSNLNNNSNNSASNYANSNSHSIHSGNNSANTSTNANIAHNTSGGSTLNLSGRQLNDLQSLSTTRFSPSNYPTNLSMSSNTVPQSESPAVSHQSLSILSVSSMSNGNYLGCLPTLSLSTHSSSSASCAPLSSLSQSASVSQHLTITSATSTRTTIATPSTSAAAPSSPSSLPSSSFVSVSSLSPSMLPARKRPRRSYSTSDGASASPSVPAATPAEPHTDVAVLSANSSSPSSPNSPHSCSATLPEASAAVHFYFPTSAAHYLLYALSDEVLLYVFSFLYEKDLSRVAQVCKRFHTIATDTELWKRLYQGLFEYDIPLFHPSPGKFEFIKPEDSDYDNPWKESLKQLYHGVHVRLKQKVWDGGRCVTVVDSIPKAFQCVEESERPLVFVHQGIHKGEQVIIESSVNVIGAAHGNVAENVIIEHDRESSVVFGPNSRHSYLGHVTVRFSPAAGTESNHGPKHYSLEVQENCSPVVEHCIIRSLSHREYRRCKLAIS